MALLGSLTAAIQQALEPSSWDDAPARPRALLRDRGFLLLLGLVCGMAAMSAAGIAGFHSTVSLANAQQQTRSTVESETAPPAADAIATSSQDGSVSINGFAFDIPQGTTVAQAAQLSGTQASPGRLLAVDGSVLEEDGGEAASVQVNGQNASMDTVLSPGDELVLSPGSDKTEPATETRVPAAYSVWADDTLGSIHQVVSDEGACEKVVLVGEVSGIKVEQESTEGLGTAHLTNYSIRPTNEKVVALTFDDGPWGETTTQLLDLLKEHDIRATFFVVGNCFDGDEEATAIVKREHDEGHQVCTHTYTHASAAKGFRMANLSSWEQIDEIERGQNAIAAATGEEASKVVRMPGGAYGEDVALNVLPYVTYEIGWDIDTLDWRRPGAAAIEEALGKAESGDVVLMHDGGGDRSQTVEALRNALPRMKAEGWRFVTIDELLAIEDAQHDPAAECKPTVAIPEPEPDASSGTNANAIDGMGGMQGATGGAYGYGYGTDAYGYGTGTEWGYVEYGSALGYGTTDLYGYGSTGYGYGSTDLYGYGATGTNAYGYGYGYDTSGLYGSY